MSYHKPVLSNSAVERFLRLCLFSDITPPFDPKRYSVVITWDPDRGEKEAFVGRCQELEGVVVYASSPFLAYASAIETIHHTYLTRDKARPFPEPARG